MKKNCSGHTDDKVKVKKINGIVLVVGSCPKLISICLGTVSLSYRERPSSGGCLINPERQAPSCQAQVIQAWSWPVSLDIYLFTETYRTAMTVVGNNLI